MSRVGLGRGLLISFTASTVVLLSATLFSGTVLLLVSLVILFFLCSAATHIALSGEAGRGGPKPFAWYVTSLDLGEAVGPLVAWSILQFMPVPCLLFGLGTTLYFVGTIVLSVMYRRGGL